MEKITKSGHPRCQCINSGNKNQCSRRAVSNQLCKQHQKCKQARTNKKPVHKPVRKPVVSALNKTTMCSDQSYSSLACKMSRDGYNMYTLRKGTILYHGSSQNIKKFNRLAYFTMHRNIAQSFIFYLGRIKPADAGKKFYLYQLQLNQDVDVLEHDINKFGIHHPTANYELSSPLTIGGKTNFCESLHQGWIAKRDVASLPLLTRKTIYYSDAELFADIKKLTGKRGLDYFYNKYCRGTFEHFNELNHDEWIDSLEFVLCNASSLATVNKIPLDATKILSRGRDFIVHYLTSWIGKTTQERRRSVKKVAYEWFLSHMDVECN